MAKESHQGYFYMLQFAQIQIGVRVFRPKIYGPLDKLQDFTQILQICVPARPQHIHVQSFYICLHYISL